MARNGLSTFAITREGFDSGFMDFARPPSCPGGVPIGFFSTSPRNMATALSRFKEKGLLSWSSDR